MPVIVDSNVILDIITDDPVWADWSDAQVSKHQPRGLVVDPVIYSELCVGASAVSEVDAVLTRLKLRYQELPREALFLASKAFLEYRRQGGAKSAPLPDFYIGAHAEASGMRLLTRDKARYQTYFPKARLILP